MYIIVSLLQGLFQGIKHMTLQTTNGLFFTCTQKIYIYIYTTHTVIYYLGTNHRLKERKNTPLTRKPDILLMVANPHPLWSLVWYELPSPYFPIPPHPYSPPWPIYIKMTTSTTLVFLSGTVIGNHMLRSPYIIRVHRHNKNNTLYAILYI